MKIQTDTGLAFDLYGPGFAAISLFRSTDKVRRYLHGVRVEPLVKGGALIIATDSVMLAVYHDATATAPRPVTLAIDKPATGREKFYFCGENLNDYVNWRGVLPSASTAMETPETIHVDAKYLNVFANAAKKLEKSSRLKIVTFVFTGERRHLIDFDDPNFYGLLMPCRISNGHTSRLRPGFLEDAL